MSVHDDTPGDKPALDDALRVRRIAEIADGVGSSRLRERAMALADRINAARVYVACIGQVKRGKSSLLNALVGEALLPTGVVPVTAVPTILRYGEERRVRIHFLRDVVTDVPLSEMAAYVSENGNPNNERGVEAVEVFVPAAILEPGLCLVDTPGLGSIVPGAAGLSHAQIPHVDAAIVVIGVDPPLSGDELDLLTKAAGTVRDLLVVLNKADRFDVEERRTARCFASQAILQRISRPIGPVLEVSARDQLARQGSSRDWDRLVAALTRLMSDDRAKLVRTTLHRGAQRLIDECLAELTELGRMAYAPVAQMEDRLEKLRAASAGTAFDWLTLHQLIERESARARQGIETRRHAFLAERIADAGYEATRTVTYSSIRRPRQLRDYHMRLARKIALRELDEWAQTETRLATDFERGFLARIAAISRAALADASVLDETVSISSMFTDDIAEPDPPTSDSGSSAAWLSAIAVDVPVPPRGLPRRLLDHIRGRDRIRQLVGREVHRHLSLLLDAGTARIAEALVGRVDAIGATVEARLRGILNTALDRADRAVALARSTRERDAESARRELARLAEWRGEVLALRAPICEPGPVIPVATSTPTEERSP